MENGDRDSRGRFRHGWRGGPGRPTKGSEQVYMECICEEVGEPKFRRLLRLLLKQAFDGDRASQAMILRYTIPVPAKLGSLRDERELRIGGAKNREQVELEMVERFLYIAAQIWPKATNTILKLMKEDERDRAAAQQNQEAEEAIREQIVREAHERPKRGPPAISAPAKQAVNPGNRTSSGIPQDR